ncbi:MAG: peptidylprolyl isomerase [Kiritimatiellia bacterium]
MKFGAVASVLVAVLVVAGDVRAAEAVKAEDPKDVLLVVNGAKLTRGELDADVAKILASFKGRMSAAQQDKAKERLRKQMARQFMMLTLLEGEIAKKGIALDPKDLEKAEADFAKGNASRPNAPKSVAEFAEKHPLGKERAMREFRDGILMKKLLDLEVASKIEVDAKKVEEVIRNIVSNNVEQAKKAVDAEAGIKLLKKQLDGLKGDELAKKFAELAKAKSDCPSKGKGGDLGEFARGQMVKPFNDVAFKIEPFTVSDPVKTPFGWHLIMVTKKIPAIEAKDGKLALPEKIRASHILLTAREVQKVPTKEQVERNLKRQEEQKAIRKYFAGLQSAAKIECPGFPDLLSESPKARPPSRRSKAGSNSIESKPVEFKPASRPATKPASKPATKPATKTKPVESAPVEVKR